MKHYDEAFVSQCRSGDRIAQRRLFEELYPWMFRTVCRYVVRYDEAEDCVMKGFMKAFQSLDKFRYEAPHGLSVWMRKIMVNEALMFLRQRHNFMLSLENDLSAEPVKNEALDRLDAEELNSLIMQLPTGYRTIFNMYVVEGYGHNEIASLLGISESTSRTQLAKARHRLRCLITQNKSYHGNYRG